MTTFKNYGATPPDDEKKVLVRRDCSSGQDTRSAKVYIDENGAYKLTNISLDQPGQRNKRPGMLQVADTFSSDACTGLFTFQINTGLDQLLVTEDTHIRKWTGSGNTASVKDDLTATAQTNIVKVKQSGKAPDDVVIVQNGTDIPVSIDAYGVETSLLDTPYSPYKTLANTWYGNRYWTLRNDLLAFSDAYPKTYAPEQATITGNYSSFTGKTGDKLKVIIDDAVFDEIDVSASTSIADVVTAINTKTGGSEATVSDSGFLTITSTTYGSDSNVEIDNSTYSDDDELVEDLFSQVADRSDSGYAPFDQTANVFRVPVGTEKALAPTRGHGLIVFGENAVWALAPSSTPSSSDQPQPIDARRGCVAGKSVTAVGDDIYYLSQDGVRSLKRTEQDKLQTGPSFPLSHKLKDEYESISWAFADRASGVWYDNKYFLALPTDSSTYNNEVWVYYPATEGWTVITGWDVADWAVYNIGGQDRLYYADSTTGKIYRAWYGYDDDGSAFTSTEETREEDMGTPLQDKVGGELEIKAISIGGSWTVDIYGSINGDAYKLLGTTTLTANDAPELAVDLPFALANSITTRDKYRLDLWDDGTIIGEWRTIRFKFENDDADNGTVVILEHNLAMYTQEHYSEGPLQ